MVWDNQVAEEDVSLVQSVQRGLESGAVPQGRLMGASEQLIADFQRRVYDALTSPPRSSCDARASCAFRDLRGRELGASRSRPRESEVVQEAVAGLG